MKVPLYRWPKVGRAFRRASVPPLLAGLFTFSLALMAAGAAAYVGALPSLAAESPFMQQFRAGSAALLDPRAPLVGTLGNEGAGGAEDAEGAAGVDNALATGAGTALGATGGAGPDAALPVATDSVVVTGTMPSVPFSFSEGGAPGAPAGGSTDTGQNVSADGGGSSAGSGNSGGNGSGGGSGPQGSGNSGGSGGGSQPAPAPEPTPEPEPPLPPEHGGPVPEDMELGIRDVLRSEYAKMEANAALVYECVDDYNRLAYTLPKEPRQAASRKVNKLLYDVQVAGANVSTEVGAVCGLSGGGIYGASRYSGNYSSMSHSYGSLVSMLYELAHAWSGNCYFDDPVANADYWSGRVTVNGATGRMAHMEAYEAARTGARP